MGPNEHLFPFLAQAIDHDPSPHDVKPPLTVELDGSGVDLVFHL